MLPEATEFLRHAKETPGASEFFARFQPKELFSPNSYVIKQTLEKFVDIPPEALMENKFYDVCLISKYISLSMPVMIFMDLFNTYLMVLNKLPLNDLDCIVSLLKGRLGNDLKLQAVLGFPDCQSTFYYLGSCLAEDELFDDAFQRLFCSFHLVPSSVTDHVYTNLMQSLKSGPARTRIPIIVRTACNYTNSSVGLLENVISAIVKTYPESLALTTQENINSATEQALRTVPIPQSVLKLLLLTQHKSTITFPSNYQFLRTCPSLLFEYLSTLPENESSNSWYLILVKFDAIPVNKDNASIFISVLLTFLGVCLKNPFFLGVVESAQVFVWFTNFVNSMGHSKEEIAVFSTFLLILRTFDVLSKAISDKDLKSALENSLKKRENRIPLTEGIVWVMDPTRDCPFRNLMDMFYRSPSLPPPCSGFVFRISPVLLGTLFSAAISDSIPKGHPTVRTPIKARRELERTHSKVRLRLTEGIDNSSNEAFNLMDTSINPIVRDLKSEDSGSGFRTVDDDVSLGDMRHLSFDEDVSLGENDVMPSQDDTVTDEDLTQSFEDDTPEEEDNYPREIESSRENLRPGPFLKLLLTSLLPMYHKTPHSELLSALSTSEILIPLIPFSLTDEEAFDFLTNALGLSCPFTVFSEVYNRLSGDLLNLSSFLSKVSETTPIVGDYLYVTSPIPLPLNSSYLSLVIWVRPHCESTLLTLAYKNVTYFIILSATDLRVPHAAAYLPIDKTVGGWIMVTLSISLNYLILSANLKTLTVPHQVDGNLNHINIGDTSSHFDMQSVRAFAAVLSEDDIAAFFAAGPTHREQATPTFIESACQAKPYIIPSGFVSGFYSSFIPEFTSKSNINSLPLLSLSFSSPFKWIRHLTRGTQIKVSPVTADRCRSHSFVNSLACHGGSRLLLHLLGEASLFKPECARLLLSTISNLCSLYPGFPFLIDQKGGYRAIGLLFRAGLVHSDDAAVLTFDKEGQIINPAALDQTLFEAMAHGSSPSLLKTLIQQARDKRGSSILLSINAFQKVANLLIAQREREREQEYLQLMKELLLTLNGPDHAIYNANIIFETLMSSLSFNDEAKMYESGLSVLVEVLEKIIGTISVGRPDIETLIPALFPAGMGLASSLSRLLVRFLPSQYLPLLAEVLISLPEGLHIGRSLTNAVTLSPGAVRVACTARVIACRKESHIFFNELGKISGIWPESTEFALFEFWKAIEATGQNIINFPFLPAGLIKSALDAGKSVELAELITRVSQIPDEPSFDISFFLLRCSLPLPSSHIVLTDLDIDRALVFTSPLASSLADKAKFSPGKPPKSASEYVEAVLSAALSSEALKALTAAVSTIADMSLMPFPDEQIRTWQTTVSSSSKLSKIKRAAEIGVFTTIRIPPLPSVNPIPSNPSLASLISRAIQRQSSIIACTIPEPSTFKAESLWRDVFTSLHFPGSLIYSNCPSKWIPSRQFPLLLLQNPSIDSTYREFWSAKYSEPLPSIRLTLDNIFDHFPTVSGDTLFHSRATLVKGISAKDGIVTVELSGIRFSPGPIINFTSLVSARTLSYLHKPSAVELIGTNETIFLAFDSPQSRDSLLDIIESRGFPVTRTIDSKTMGEQTKKWLEGTLTNFDYLLYLNELSGRTFTDFTQYPIFPWILSDYKSGPSSFSLKSPTVFRDLSLPIFAQTAEQQEECKQYFLTTQTLQEDPQHVPNYISNVGSSIYYLVRLEPYTGEEVRFQSGALDAADRTFQSLLITFSLMTTPGNRNALEAIPELYALPEMFTNVNNIDFPRSPITGRVVGDVELPPWAGTSRNLVRVMRQALEGQAVSEKLSDWIDLIWGVNRRGTGSHSRFNVFPRTVYEFDDSTIASDKVLIKAMKGKVKNCGQAAAQLFRAPHPKKRVKDTRETRDSAGKLVFVSENKGFIRDPNPDVTFSDELAVTCMDTRGKVMVTGHAIPIICTWRFDKGIELDDTAGIHQARVTTVSLSPRGIPLVAVGHEDGFVTLLTEKPLRFVRFFETGFTGKVKVIKFVGLDGDFVICQGRHVSLVTVNGQMVSSFQTREEITDAIGTGYPPGTKQNFVFILSGEEVYCLDTSRFEVRSLIRVRGSGTGLALRKGIVIVAHENDRVSCIKVE